MMRRIGPIELHVGHYSLTVAVAWRRWLYFVADVKWYRLLVSVWPRRGSFWMYRLFVGIQPPFIAARKLRWYQ